MDVQRILGVIRKINRNNYRYYWEQFYETRRRWKYPSRGIDKYFINVLKRWQINTLIGKYPKLHVGCGELKIDSFVNIDVVKTVATDFVCNIYDLPKYISDGTIEMIYLSHTLEHFPRSESISLLRMFHDMLRPGGELRISVPDMKKIMEIAIHEKLTINEMELLQGIMMGGQDTRYNYHKSAYWYDLLESQLQQIGFRNIKEYPAYPHFLGKHIHDASSLAKIREKYISLNVYAIK